MSFVDELRSLDTNDPGRWPLPFRIGAIALAFAGVVAAGVWYFVVQDEMPRLERAQRLGRLASQRPHERAVVLVRDLPGAVVELELLERPERAVAALGQLEPPPVDLVRLVEHVAAGIGLAQIGQRDDEHARHREQGAEDESQAHVLAGASAPS